MNSTKIKKDFHNLIDKIENDSILKKFYELLDQASKRSDGKLWDRLSQEEKDELIQIDIESEDENNLISLSEMKNKHKKWLKK